MAAFERATVGLFLWWSANAALVDNPCRLVSASRFNVEETTDRIANGARVRGLEVRERTDHAALAQRDGFHLRPTQSLIVDGLHGAEPVRLVIWQAHSGLTMVSTDGIRAGEAARLGPELPQLLNTLSTAREGAPAWRQPAQDRIGPA